MNAPLPFVRLDALEGQLRSRESGQDILDLAADLRLALGTIARWLQCGTPFTTKREVVEGLLSRWVGPDETVTLHPMPAPMREGLFGSAPIGRGR